MKLNQLLVGIMSDPPEKAGSINIRGITNDSRKVSKGDLFVAISGYMVDGHKYIQSAVEAGAAAIVGEKDEKEINTDVPYFRVSDGRKALAQLARIFYNPDQGNKVVIGITGTNGKTTTSFMLKHILEYAGKTCSLFGSVYNIVNGEKEESTVNTTMDTLTLQKALNKSKDEYVIMEVSSHALSQYRVEGIEYDIAIFTNLDHDHLDYHKNMEDYFLTKAKLFEKLKQKGTAIVDIDTQWGSRLCEMLSNEEMINLSTTGCRNADLCIRASAGKAELIEESGLCLPLVLPIMGTHNLHNAALAYQAARTLGLNPLEIIATLKGFEGVPGRFEVKKLPNGATFVIDYAHTGDAFSHCLKTAREMGAKRIIHIFGFRGDRDKSKRKKMVEASMLLSDLYILTLDDLHSETESEMANILHSLNTSKKGVVILDRTEAIEYACRHSADGDWILITGKGDEKYHHSYTLPTSSDKETLEYVIGEREQRMLANG